MRRMHVLHTEEVTDYTEKLRQLPHEADQLFREMLISVTRFFRDGDAFDALEAAVIPLLLANTGNADPIRVWVAGCATGKALPNVSCIARACDSPVKFTQ